MEEVENIAQTLARELPRPVEMEKVEGFRPGQPQERVFAVPSGFKLERINIAENNTNPQRAVGNAVFTDPDSFLAYVKRHRVDSSTVVWCKFDPKTYALSFKAVFDDHGIAAPGWRKHSASFEPAKSIEWDRWTSNDRKAKSQVEFALFIEDNAADINGTPTEADMLKMATEFEVRQDLKLKSAVRLQSGGVRMEYVDTDDAATVQQMQVFDSFAIAVPVFMGAQHAEVVKAKLRYRQQAGAVSFWYELQRADKAHKQAADDLINVIREGIGGLPLLMGSL